MSSVFLSQLMQYCFSLVFPREFYLLHLFFEWMMLVPESSSLVSFLLSKKDIQISFLLTKLIWISKFLPMSKQFANMVVHKKVNTCSLLWTRRTYKAIHSWQMNSLQEGGSVNHFFLHYPFTFELRFPFGWDPVDGPQIIPIPVGYFLSGFCRGVMGRVLRHHTH